METWHFHYFFEMNHCMVHLRSDIVDIVIAGRSEGLLECFKLELMSAPHPKNFMWIFPTSKEWHFEVFLHD